MLAPLEFIKQNAASDKIYTCKKRVDGAVESASLYLEYITATASDDTLYDCLLDKAKKISYNRKFLIARLTTVSNEYHCHGLSHGIVVCTLVT